MDTRRKEILELIKLMAWNTRTVEYAQYYLEGPGKYASPKELTLHVIELMTQDGSAMGFEPGDDIGDIVAVINTIAGNDTYKSTADVNGDNSIDISDIVSIINIIAGK